jgi:hypothetical protein
MSRLCCLERGIDVSHETVRFWWNRFGPLFAADIRRQRVSRMKDFCHWNWHLDKMCVKISRRDALPVACGRPDRRNPRQLRYQNPRQEGALAFTK